uniref:Uncharacterized protein n=1 Tax=Cucumis melo TaxID=3656 RepID=A0A9I9E8V0_CUCME
MVFKDEEKKTHRMNRRKLIGRGEGGGGVGRGNGRMVVVEMIGTAKKRSELFPVKTTTKETTHTKQKR